MFWAPPQPLAQTVFNFRRIFPKVKKVEKSRSSVRRLYESVRSCTNLYEKLKVTFFGIFPNAPLPLVDSALAEFSIRRTPICGWPRNFRRPNLISHENLRNHSHFSCETGAPFTTRTCHGGTQGRVELLQFKDR